jgi:hydrogenase maturation protein HypF
VHYEGQAAIALEMIADSTCRDSYHFELEAQGSMISVAPVLLGMVQDLQAHVPTPVIAAKFHQAVAEVITRVATRLRHQEGLQRVVLSGGVLQNQLLREWTWQRLDAASFDVYMHHRVPTNDAGISLGQAVVAAARLNVGKG